MSTATPCIKVCSMDDETEYCLGCARSLPEVARWSRLSDAQRQQVLDALPARKAEMIALGVDIRWRS